MTTPAKPASPLPWSLAHTKQLEPFITNSAGNITYADSIHGGTMKESEANAQYIVQACNAFPALYAALERLDRIVSTRCSEEDTEAMLMLFEARTALALARGEKAEPTVDMEAEKAMLRKLSDPHNFAEMLTGEKGGE